MKRKYEKPQLFMESFEVAEFIAGTCTIKYDLGAGGEPTAQDATHCNASWSIAPGNVFLKNTSPADCQCHVDEMKLCYNGPGYNGKTWLS